MASYDTLHATKEWGQKAFDTVVSNLTFVVLNYVAKAKTITLIDFIHKCLR